MRFYGLRENGSVSNKDTVCLIHNEIDRVKDIDVTSTTTLLSLHSPTSSSFSFLF